MSYYYFKSYTISIKGMAKKGSKKGRDGVAQKSPLATQLSNDKHTFLDTSGCYWAVSESNPGKLAQVQTKLLAAEGIKVSTMDKLKMLEYELELIGEALKKASIRGWDDAACAAGVDKSRETAGFHTHISRTFVAGIFLNNLVKKALTPGLVEDAKRATCIFICEHFKNTLPNVGESFASVKDQKTTGPPNVETSDSKDDASSDSEGSDTPLSDQLD